MNDDDDEMCPCGCGSTRRAVVRELMQGPMALNHEQAESIIEAAARNRSTPAEHAPRSDADGNNGNDNNETGDMK